MSILVTGSAGFIGFHVAQRLLDRGETVVGVDNFDPYYDVALKRARAAMLEKHPAFEQIELNIADRQAMPALFADAASSASSTLPRRRGYATRSTTPTITSTPT